MKVLITGSSGFIGRHLVDGITECGHSVLGVDVKIPVSRPAGFTFQECDILDAEKLKTLFLRFDPTHVIHLAARTDLDEKADLPIDYAANVGGVDNIVAAVQSTSSVVRCVYTSTQLVCRPGYVPQNNKDWQPHTKYGESKVLGEQIVYKNNGGGKSWCIVRPTTVWGPGMNKHYQNFISMVEKGRYFHVGRKLLLKSYGYVGNLVHQYMKLLEVPEANMQGKMLYLADYDPISLRRWVDMLSDELGSGSIVTVPTILARFGAYTGDIVNLLGYKDFPFNSFRLNNVLTEYQVDTSDTERICGALPYSMEDGVRETVDWYKQLNNY
ncbi:MAG: NAD(P)-dependent oxidoreductase [Chloroflexota bacterium]|nr:NAD(P)-dependent oxidoreductase [Chloroflexota bacterium]